MSGRITGALMARLPVALVLVATVAGCGVRPTAIVDAGQPAEGVARGPRLFFVKDGELAGYVRPIGKLGELHDAVRLLLEGPPEGMTTALPARLKLVSVGEESAEIEARFTGAARLSDQARGQIVCTLSERYAATSSGSKPFGIVLVLGGRRFKSAACDSGAIP